MSGTSSSKILWVDFNDLETRHSISKLVGQYDVVAVSDRQAALYAMEHNRPDLVFLGQTGPGILGNDGSDELLQKARDCGAKVVAITEGVKAHEGADLTLAYGATATQIAGIAHTMLTRP